MTDISLIDSWIIIICITVLIGSKLLKQRYMEMQNLARINQIASEVKKIDEHILEVESLQVSRPGAKIKITAWGKELELQLETMPLTAAEIVDLYINRLKSKKSILIQQAKPL